MWSRVPVVSTRLSGIPEVVRDGVTGLLVEPGNETVLAEAMIRLFTDPQLCERLTHAGHRQIAERFNIRKNIGRLIQLLEAKSEPLTKTPH
jgi:glycosyltransferase involved in cell wall biosynthesis